MTANVSQHSSFLRQGSGWRVGYRAGQAFPALLGSDVWALELTESEWQAFVAGIQHLAAAMTAAKDYLMAGEGITLEHTSEGLTLTVTGDPQAYRLFVQLHYGRRGEGLWDPDAVGPLLQAIESFLG